MTFCHLKESEEFERSDIDLKLNSYQVEVKALQYTSCCGLCSNCFTLMQVLSIWVSESGTLPVEKWEWLGRLVWYLMYINQIKNDSHVCGKSTVKVPEQLQETLRAVATIQALIIRWLVRMFSVACIIFLLFTTSDALKQSIPASCLAWAIFKPVIKTGKK